MQSDKIYQQFDSSMEFTGERMVPENAGAETFWEHIYRYRFAKKFVRNQRVLDIACGEGYGAAALLHAGASHVFGIDISANTCGHARSKYGLDVSAGDALNIPLQDRTVDLIVSFETIEHVDQPQKFLDECARILVPNGLLIISTPNRDVYSENGKHNVFHKKELNLPEFVDLVSKKFDISRLYTQLPRKVGFWSSRSLVAGSTLWVHVPGFWRLRHIIRKISHFHVLLGADAYFRENTIRTINNRDNFFSYLVNPYEIRKFSLFHREKAQYLIAILRNRI